MPDIDTVLGWRGKSVRDASGEKLGTIGALYLDRLRLWWERRRAQLKSA